MKRRYKIVKTVFSVLIFLVLLCTFALNIFAYDSPPMFSSGYLNDEGYIYTGNTDISVSLGVSAPDSYYYNYQLSTSLNPSISYDMTVENISVVSNDTISPVHLDGIEINRSFYDFESSDDYFVSGLVSDNSWFASEFNIEYFNYSGSVYVNFVEVSARDFYFYLDPNGDEIDPNYDDYFAESFIYLRPNSFFNGAEGTIYYCLAGQEDTAANRQVYNYSYSTEDTTSGLISMLPVDQSLSGAFDEPTLIYVEYLVLNIPLDEYGTHGLFGFLVSGIYANYNMDYRNIDISSYEDPISPINPGIFRDYTGWIGTAVGGFLDLQIVDGFTLGGVLMVIIAFMITLWFLKVFAGG